MYTLSEERFRKEAAPALRRIFEREDPWDQPFARSVEIRRLLYPVSCVPEPWLLDAIAYAAKETGDLGFYWSVIERPASEAQDRPYHWYIPFAEMTIYESFSDPFVLENVLYSPRGQWGIMTSHEDHALLGGTLVFFQAMRKVAPEFDNMNQVRDFLSDWKEHRARYGSDISWIPGLLTNVYDAETTHHLLTEANLTDLL